MSGPVRSVLSQAYKICYGSSNGVRVAGHADFPAYRERVIIGIHPECTEVFVGLAASASNCRGGALHVGQLRLTPIEWVTNFVTTLQGFKSGAWPR